jgi:hypothetical protein
VELGDENAGEEINGKEKQRMSTSRYESKSKRTVKRVMTNSSEAMNIHSKRIIEHFYKLAA